MQNLGYSCFVKYQVLALLTVKYMTGKTRDGQDLAESFCWIELICKIVVERMFIIGLPEFWLHPSAINFKELFGVGLGGAN